MLPMTEHEKSVMADRAEVQAKMAELNKQWADL